MAHAPPHLHKRAHHQLQFRQAQAAFGQLAIAPAAVDQAPHHRAGLGFAGVGRQRAQGGLAAIGQHQQGRFAAAGVGAPVAEALLGDLGVAFAGLVQEVAHLQGALVFRDEVG